MLRVILFLLVTLPTFYFGLDAFGYKDPWQLIFYILVLTAISRFLVGCFNEVVFRIDLAATATVFANQFSASNLPAPRKYGFTYDEPRLEVWHGQDYFMDICRDRSVAEGVKCEARCLLRELQTARLQGWASGRRAERLVFEAVKMYDKTLSQIEGVPQQRR